MKTRTVTLLAVIAGLVASCSPIYTSFDWDPKVEFSKFDSYSWMEIKHSPARNLSEFQARTSLTDQRVKQAVDIQLLEKGLTRKEEGGALLVNYYTSMNEMLEVSQNTYSATGMWVDSRIGGSAVNVNENVEGTLIIDLIDAQYNTLVWRGIAEGAWDKEAPPSEVNAMGEKAIEKLFRKYPPK